MKKEQIREQLNKAGSLVRAHWIRCVLILAGLLFLYVGGTYTENRITLISGQKYQMENPPGKTLKHHEGFSQISEGELTALEAGTDRFVALSPGHTDYYTLEVLDTFCPEKTRIEGEIGDTAVLQRYSNLENTFESMNPSGVSVEEDGTLHMLNAGGAVVVQTIGGFQKVYYAVIVGEPRLDIVPDVIYTGETAVASLEGYEGPDTDASYSSSTGCVSVREGHLPDALKSWAKEQGLDPAGARITGINAGEAVISASLHDTEVEGTVRVSDPPYIKEENTLLIGDKKTLDIANAIDSVTYESSDENVVAVRDGELHVLDSGKCTVTARVRDKTCSREFEIPEPEIVCSEERIGLGAEVKFTLENIAGEVKWSSSDPEILAMEEDGSAKGLRSGTVTVTAQTELFDFTCDTVVARDFYGADLIPDDLPDGVKALLSCVFYYEDCLQEDIELGLKWQYSNHGWANNFFKPFDTIDSGADGYRSCNCDSGHQWIIQDLEGVKSYRGFADFYSGGASLKSLMDAGKVRPGDIFMGYRIDKDTGKKIGHSFIYLGDNMTFDTGHGSGGWHSDGSIPHTDPRKAVFDTWIHPTDSSFTYTGYTLTRQVRLHDSYIPSRYRNSEGELVSW
ncbi:MAG: Ig-like domain-containing protein [Lachnospiraceae bacterium]|nr:Ig-like domain-containing protein [Lachnospiraceae bacterium]